MSQFPPVSAVANIKNGDFEIKLRQCSSRRKITLFCTNFPGKPISGRNSSSVETSFLKSTFYRLAINKQVALLYNLTLPKISLSHIAEFED